MGGWESRMGGLGVKVGRAGPATLDLFHHLDGGDDCPSGPTASVPLLGMRERPLIGTWRRPSLSRRGTEGAGAGHRHPDPGVVEALSENASTRCPGSAGRPHSFTEVI